RRRFPVVDPVGASGRWGARGRCFIVLPPGLANKPPFEQFAGPRSIVRAGLSSGPEPSPPECRDRPEGSGTESTRAGLRVGRVGASGALERSAGIVNQCRRGGGPPGEAVNSREHSSVNSC